MGLYKRTTKADKLAKARTKREADRVKKGKGK